MGLPYACLGHWYVQIAFAGPSLLIFGAMGRDKVRNRWRAHKGLEPITASQRKKAKVAQARGKSAPAEAAAKRVPVRSQAKRA